MTGESPAGGLIEKLTTNHNLMGFLRASRLYLLFRGVYHAWYAPRRLRFYSSFVRPDDLVFDIGANIGTRLGTFLELGAQVVAVEPQTTCFSALLRKHRSNPKVHLIHAGLDGADGMKAIHLCENDALSSMSDRWIAGVRESGRFGTLRWERQEMARVTTLDSIIEQYGIPSFCKIDVEGYELHVIQGLSKRIPCLSFEYNPELRGDSEEIIQRLSEIGEYVFNYCVGEPDRLEMAQWVDPVQMMSTLKTLASGHLDIFAKRTKQDRD